MNDKVYEIIDDINKLDIINKLKDIKNKIENDETAKELIKKFNSAKELYEKYNIKDEFIKAKTNLLKNELVKEYIEIQNKINMLTMYINKRLNNITKNRS